MDDKNILLKEKQHEVLELDSYSVISDGILTFKFKVLINVYISNFDNLLSLSLDDLEGLTFINPIEMKINHKQVIVHISKVFERTLNKIRNYIKNP